jgi:hypothetical protein
MILVGDSMPMIADGQRAMIRFNRSDFLLNFKAGPFISIFHPAERIHVTFTPVKTSALAFTQDCPGRKITSRILLHF